MLDNLNELGVSRFKRILSSMSMREGLSEQMEMLESLGQLSREDKGGYIGLGTRRATGSIRGWNNV